MNIYLRQSTEEDIEFLFKLHESGLRTCVERQFGVWDDDRQRESFMGKLDLSRRQLILHNDVRIGCFGVIRNEEDIYIEYIVILPEYQGQGIGGKLIKDVLQEADTKGIPARLGLLKLNSDALKLYTRLGFVRTSTDDVKIHMRYEPSS